MERRRSALALRRAGCSYEEIARQLKVSRSTAFKYVETELAALNKEIASEAEALKLLVLGRLDAVLQRAWETLTAKDVRDELRLKAGLLILRTEHERSSIMGYLKAPVPILPPEEPKPSAERTGRFLEGIMEAASVQELQALAGLLRRLKGPTDSSSPSQESGSRFNPVEDLGGK